MIKSFIAQLIKMIDIYMLDRNEIKTIVANVISDANSSKLLVLSYDKFQQLYLKNIYRFIQEDMPITSFTLARGEIQQYTSYPCFKDNVDEAIIQQLCSKQLDNRIRSLQIARTYFTRWKQIIQTVSLRCRLLTTIDISANEAKDNVLQLIYSAQWKFIKCFNCSYNHITSNGIKYLSQCQWPFLSELDIKGNKINNKGIAYLAKSNWPSLKELMISENNLTSDGLKTFLQCNWQNLSYLSLDSEFGNEGLKLIQRMLTNKLTCIILQENVIYPPNQCKKFYHINQIAKQDMHYQTSKIIVPYSLYPYNTFRNLSNVFRVRLTLPI